MEEIKALLSRKEREMEELSKKLERLKEEVDSLRTTLVLLSSEEAKSGLRLDEDVSFFGFFENFCKEMKSDVYEMCETLGFSRGAYYQWKKGSQISGKIRALIANGISQLSGGKYPAQYVSGLIDRTMLEQSGHLTNLKRYPSIRDREKEEA